MLKIEQDDIDVKWEPPWATKKSTVEGHRKALWVEVNPVELGGGGARGSVVGYTLPLTCVSVFWGVVRLAGQTIISSFSKKYKSERIYLNVTSLQ